MPKRKQTSGPNPNPNPDLPYTYTSRNPPWAYFQLELISDSNTSPPSPPALDPLTARTHLTSALSQFLGLSGTAIPIDILKLATEKENEKEKERNILWIRVPFDDAAAVTGAVSSWMGSDSSNGSVAWRIRKRGAWLGALVGESGEELFGP